MKRKKGRMDMLAQQILAMQEELEEVNWAQGNTWPLTLMLQGGDAGRLGGVKHSGAGRCHQEAGP